MSTNKNESDTPLPTSATPSQEEETEHKTYHSDGLTEEEAERIRCSNGRFQARYHAAQNQAAAVVAESMAIWERDEEIILEYLKNASKKNDPTP